MLSRVKNAFYNAVTSLDTIGTEDQALVGKKRAKFPYSRPSFLQLNTNDEVLVSADHVIRPIIVPRDIAKIPWNVGYAEAVNAGKSSRNEDQAAMQVVTLRRDSMTQHTIFASEALSNSPSGSLGFSYFKSNNSHPVNDIVITDPIHEVSPDERNIANGDNVQVNDAVDNASPTATEFSTPPTTPDINRRALKTVTPADSKCTTTNCLPYVYFGIFDGHAGSGAAVVAANELHRIVQEKLMNVVELLIASEDGSESEHATNVTPKPLSLSWNIEKQVNAESLVIGALESAFVEMDNIIAADRFRFKITGGCTSLVALFIFGKLFVANAGDSRAVLCKNGKAIPMSYDFTPETERDRVKYLAKLNPQLLGDDFTQLEFVRRPIRKDIGKKLLYRDSMMKGWSYKIITPEDLKFPLVYGEGKRSRVLATIGVTRGFGDHDLKAQNSQVLIKPFLSCQPEVLVYDLMKNDVTSNDVLVMGTDGLWDITSNEKAAEVVQKSLDHFPTCDKARCQIRYTSAAQDLVMHSRGKLRDRNWKTSDDKPATIDDISVFVIPLLPYKKEFSLFMEENPWVKDKM